MKRYIKNNASLLHAFMDSGHSEKYLNMYKTYLLTSLNNNKQELLKYDIDPDDVFFDGISFSFTSKEEMQVQFTHNGHRYIVGIQSNKLHGLWDNISSNNVEEIERAVSKDIDAVYYEINREYGGRGF